MEERIKKEELLERLFHDDYENLKLNTAISACMIFVKKIREDGFITRDELRKFLVILNPLAPHITSEIYENVFGGDILNETWPEFDESKTQENTVEYPVQVNGKLRATVTVNRDADQAEVIEKVKQLNKLTIDFDNLRKVIFVKGKIINFIV